MKTKLLNNFGTKILSVLLALITWIIILNFYDPVTTRSFVIPVEMMNESVIESLNMVYDIKEGEAVTISAKGSRSKVDTLKASDFKATANLEKLSLTNAVPIFAECLKYPSNEISVSITGKTDTVLVTLEERETEQFPVKFKYTGTVAEGYYCDTSQTQAKPIFISVSGGASVIESISAVVVDINLANAEEDFTISGEPEAIDKNGYPVTEKLRFGRSEIDVSVVVLSTKTVDLLLSIVGAPASDYKLVSVDQEPKQVLIAGKDKDLKDVSSVVISKDITGTTESIDEDINISEYLPDNVKLVDEALTAMAIIKIEKLETKEITVPLESIELRNLPIDMKFDWLETNHRIIKVIGLKNVLSKIDINSIKPYIDLTGMTQGLQYVELKFDTDEDIEIAVSPGIYVSLSSIYEETTENTTLKTETETEPDINEDDEVETE